MKVFCTNCFTDFDAEFKGNYFEDVVCPNCGNTFTFDSGERNLRIYKENNSEDTKNTSDIDTQINETELELQRILKYAQQLEERKKEQKRLLKYENGYKRGLVVYSPSPDTEFVGISLKLPREMYKKVTDTIRQYYNGSMTTYIQSLIAMDISKNYDFYETYARQENKKVGKSKRIDVYLKEAFYDMAAPSIPLIPGVVNNRKDDRFDDYFNERLCEYISKDVFKLFVKGKKIKFDPESKGNLYCLFNDALEKFNKKQTESGDDLGGLHIALTYEEGGNEYRVVKLLLPKDLYGSFRRKRRVGICENIYQAFIKTNYVCITYK